MEALFAQIKQLAENAGEAAREKLLDQLRGLTYSLESEDDTMQRVIYRVSNATICINDPSNFKTQQLEIVMIRLSEDLKLFELIASSEAPLTVEQLSKETGAAPVMLGRVLRYLASMKLIKETGKDEFTFTNVTKILAKPGNAAGVYHQ